MSRSSAVAPARLGLPGGSAGLLVLPASPQVRAGNPGEWPATSSRALGSTRNLVQVEVTMHEAGGELLGDAELLVMMPVFNDWDAAACLIQELNQVFEQRH